MRAISTTDYMESGSTFFFLLSELLERNYIRTRALGIAYNHRSLIFVKFFRTNLRISMN